MKDLTMIPSVILPARSISPLQSCRFDRTISVQKGQVNVILGERIVMLSAGSSLTITRGTLHAISNLSLSPVVMDEVPQDVSVTTIFAAANGEVYATHRSCVLQITLSLYAGLLADLSVPMVELRQAA